MKNNESIEVIPPNEQMMDMVKEIIKQNQQIIEINTKLVDRITITPVMIYKSDK